MNGDAAQQPGPIVAVDHAVARLTTDVVRLDAIDLDAPWEASQRSRRDLLVALVRSLHADAVPEDSSHGWPVAGALGDAWAHRRASLLADAPAVATHATVEILAAIHDVHVALDVGVHRHDLQPLDAGVRHHELQPLDADEQ